MRKIIMVKKLLANGEPCAKCLLAQEQLERRGLWGQIDEVVWANEGEPTSAGLELARQYGVDLAPFFIVQEPGQTDRVYTSTLKLIQELSAPRAPAQPAPEPPAAAEPTVAGANPSEPGPSIDPGELAEAVLRLQNGSPAAVLAWASNASAAPVASRSAAPKTWC